MNWHWLLAPLLLAAAMSPAVADVAPEGDAQRDPALEAKLAGIDQRAGQIQDLTARFEQRKSTALLKKPLLSSGQVRMKGSTVRWDTTVPEPGVLHSDGRLIRLYYPGQKVMEVYPIDRRLTDLAASPLPRLAALREHFRIEETELPAVAAARKGAGQLALRLTPTEESLKEHVESVVVVLDVAGAYLRQVEMNDADGDRTLIRFLDVTLNTGLRDADVELAVPAGTRVSRPLEGVERPATERPAAERKVR